MPTGKGMKFLAELTDSITPKVLTEASGSKSYTIEGIFLQAEVRNRNGRRYPADVMEKEVHRYNTELIQKNRAMGELGHPDDPHIHLDRVSHLITSLESSNRKDWIRRAKIMDTPQGRIVRAFIDENVTFGVSSRGVGSLRPSADGNVVGEDFYLATAADIVADPSAPDAFVRGIHENKEWVWQNGILMESTVHALKQELIAAPKKKSAAKRLTEEVVFAKFLDGLKVEAGHSKRSLQESRVIQLPKPIRQFVINYEPSNLVYLASALLGEAASRTRNLSDASRIDSRIEDVQDILSKIARDI